MNKKIKTTLFVLALTTSAQANLLQLGADHFAPFHGVDVPKTAEMDLIQKYPLTTVSYGLRVKQIIWPITVNVYVAELMVSQPEQFARTSAAEALTSLLDMDAIVLRLHFLRDVTAEQISEAFTEGLTKNNIQPGKHEKEYLAAVLRSGNITEGSVITVAANPKIGSLSFEDSKNGLTNLNPGATAPNFVKNMLSIWFGTPSDDKFKDLQTQLLAKPAGL